MIIHKLFPTVIAEFDLSNLLNSNNIKNELDRYYSNDTDHSLVEEGFSSYNKIDILNTPDFSIVKELFQDCVNQYTNALDLVPVNISNSWFNVMEKSSKTGLHRHEGSICSGAFYPFVKDNSSDLKFHSPLKPYRMNELFLSENHLNTYFHYVPAKENTLYIFPSWLEHETDINQSEKRYVISFNTDRVK